jgi:hypothetical protein
MSARTIYSVRDRRGATHPVTDAERAERLARAGYRVTATTIADRTADS